jgi:Putative peptidoglycan binding domain
MRTRLPLPGRRIARPEEPAPASRDGAAPERSRRRRAAPVALGAVTVAAAGVAAAALLGGADEDGGPAVRGGGSAVAVRRQTLVARETVQGTLGYAGTRTVLNRLGGSGADSGDGSTGDAASDGAASASSGSAETGIPAATTTAASTSSPAATPAVYFAQDRSEGDPNGDQPDNGDQADSGTQPDGNKQPDRNETPEDDKQQDDDTTPDDNAKPRDGSGQDGASEDPTNDSAPSEDETGEAPSEEGSQQNGSSPDDSPESGGSATDDGSSGDPSASGGGSSSGSGGGSSSGSDPTGSNTVTALPGPGSVVRRGGVLYRLDGEPVVLMYGPAPAYRDLEVSVGDGRDVRQLERNLAALGFDPGTVDTTYTTTTAAAVNDWQESAGLPETGTVELGRVVFLPGARRIGEHKTEVGSVVAAGAEVLDTSSTRRVVTIELDAALQSIAREGDGVGVTLPDQSTVRGRITDVGRVAREKEDSGGDAGTDPAAEPELVIDVTVRLRSARGLGRLDEAPVSVGLAQESRRNVLAVPVNALVARRGGGYGVELAAGRRIVPVRTGLFAGGYVEVAGSGIREGMRVVVPDA